MESENLLDYHCTVLVGPKCGITQIISMVHNVTSLLAEFSQLTDIQLCPALVDGDCLRVELHVKNEKVSLNILFYFVFKTSVKICFLMFFIIFGIAGMSSLIWFLKCFFSITDLLSLFIIMLNLVGMKIPVETSSTGVNWSQLVQLN